MTRTNPVTDPSRIIYEGHPLVLKVIAEDILNRFAGNVCGYWQIHQQQFEQVARELQATRLDETEYNEALDRKVQEKDELRHACKPWLSTSAIAAIGELGSA